MPNNKVKAWTKAWTKRCKCGNFMPDNDYELCDNCLLKKYELYLLKREDEYSEVIPADAVLRVIRKLEKEKRK